MFHVERSGELCKILERNFRAACLISSSKTIYARGIGRIVVILRQFSHYDQRICSSRYGMFHLEIKAVHPGQSLRL